MDQEQEPRERSFIRELIPDWRPTGEHKLRAGRIAILVVVVVLTVLLLLYLIGLLFGVTLWNVLKVMAVPITVGVAVPFLNWLQRNRAEKLERQRAQDEALQAYLEQMSQLLTDKERPLHRCQPSDKLSFVVRSRTLTVLSRLDPERNVRVVQFLYEAGLIFSSSGVVQLSRADLREIDLSAADLREIHLGMAVLTYAKLLGAELREAKLRRVHLSGADLTYATLPRADLRGADLRSAELRNTHLKGSDLSGAYLGGANLRDASGITDEQLEEQAKTLEGATPCPPARSMRTGSRAVRRIGREDDYQM